MCHLPKQPVAYPALLKRLGDGPLVEVEALGAGGDAVDAAARVPAAGEELGPGRRADRLHEEPLEPRPVAGERVDVRGPQVRVPVQAQVAPPLVVRQDDQDVRS